MPQTLPLSPQGVSQRFFRRRAEDALPLNIEHQRIYILPSKRGLAFLLALTVCLIASINYQLNLGYALCFLLAGLFCASLMHTYRNLAGITLESAHVNSVTCGHIARFVLRITNDSPHDRVGIDIKYADQSVRTDLPSESTTRVALPLLAQQRGYLSLGRLTFNSQYPVSLWTTWSYCHAPIRVIVHPTPEDHAPPLPLAYAEGGANSEQRSFDGDVAGLRDYVAGDALMHIAWKRAARTGGAGGLHVRELEQSELGGDIELTISQTRATGLEAQLSRLAAWVNEATQTGAAFSLTLSDAHIATGSGESHRLHCLEALGIHRADEQPPTDVNGAVR